MAIQYFSISIDSPQSRIGITPEDFIKGKGRAVHRNPLLAQIMYYSKDIENFGTGIMRIAEACEEAGVKYEFVSDNYGFTVIFYRPPLWKSDKLEENLKVSVGDNIGDSDVDNDVDADVDKDVGKDVSKDVDIVVSELKIKILEIMKSNPRVSAKHYLKLWV